MSRRRHTANNMAVSLFPFLAVLICTMGVLIIMLVVAVKSSHVRAADRRRDHEETVAAKKEQLLDNLDLQQFRVREYEAMRPGLQEQLAAQRARRSHLEEATRHLIEEARSLDDAWKQTEAAVTKAVEARGDDNSQIRNLESELSASQVELDALRKQVTDRPVLYSIVPTTTAGGTSRRPIYVECRPDGILLQPTGIHLSLDDFTMPVIAGNPLDAALLATREHWKRFDIAGTHGDPYPLLVIRPGGASAYAVARRAMTSWEDEFGYELLDSGVEIDWGDQDRELAVVLRQAITDAQNRQRQMVAIRKVQWLGKTPDNDGGFVSTSARDSSPSDFTGNNSQFGENTTSSIAKTENTNAQSGDMPTGSGNRFLNNPLRDGGGDFDYQATSDGDAIAENAENSGTTNPSNTDSSNFPNGNGNAALALTGGNSGSGSASAPKVSPLSESRGQNWALPTRTPGATAYRRPIRVDCTEKSFVVHSSDPARASVNVAITDSIDSSIDALVNQIWTHIEEWGMAEAGGYWKPVLRLSAIDEATARADELERKLDGSGIEIERTWR